MRWTSIGEFLAMGGYGTFVWGSYAVAALVVVVELGLVVHRFRAARRAAAAGPEPLPDRD
jgi:heme exporter protein D